MTDGPSPAAAHGETELRGSFVVLAGGGSVRMGRDKARLEVGGRPLLLRLLEVGREACREGIVVTDRPGGYDDLLSGWARQGWPLRTACDRSPGLGPVAGLEAGLDAASEPSSFVAACDLPWLGPAFVRGLVEALEGTRGEGDPDRASRTAGGARGPASRPRATPADGRPRAVVPVREGRDQPLCAAYETRAAAAAADCLEAGEAAVGAFLDRLAVRRLGEAELAALVGREEALRGTTDVDRPADLLALLGPDAPQAVLDPEHADPRNDPNDPDDPNDSNDSNDPNGGIR